MIVSRQVICAVPVLTMLIVMPVDTKAGNMVVVGDNGRSTLVVSGDESVVLFRHTLELPDSGGSFRRLRVWTDRQELRITTFNGQCLVFLGKKRVGTAKFVGRKAGDILFRYQELGSTLTIIVLEPPDEHGENEGARVVKLEALITRP